MEHIIKSLEELVKVHDDLLAFSKEKTEIIKEGSIDKFQALLVRERKLIRQVEKAEENRKFLVDEWYEKHSLPLEKATITDLLERQEDEQEKTRLERATIDLTIVITNIKAQEKLNMALINQSMQFVQVSLDLLSPTLKNMNYGNKTNTEPQTHSVFDSKA